jgi:CubicO group peptidase (beta-lactamase class C family)
MATMAQQAATQPRELGIDPEKLEAVFARARRDVDDGTLPSCQVAVARHGQIAGLRSYGRTIQGIVDRPVTDETLYTVFSATKAVVASAIWLLIERDQLRIEELVADIIPQFATNGKEVITVEQVLLHTAGFPGAPFRAEDWDNHPRRLERFATWRLNFEPGSRYEYHPVSAHWVLAEIIERRSGRDFRAFLKEEITGPIGMDGFYLGLPPEHDRRVAHCYYVSEPEAPPGGWGVQTPEFLLVLNRPEARRAGVPGGGGIANAAQLALFYQVLINGGRTAHGRQVLQPETIEYATAVRSNPEHLDAVSNVPTNRGLSIQVAGGDGQAALRGFGRTVSARAFGHAGAGGQIAWGDPETGISLCYLTNGFADYLTMGRRTTALCSLAGSCLA